MDIATKVVNRPTGQSYRVSTAEIKRVGAWQTAVFREGCGLLGRFRPALVLRRVHENGVGAPEVTATSALGHIQHHAVEGLVRYLHPEKWERARRDLIARLSRRERGEADSLGDGDDELAWDPFAGVENTKDVLKLKAEITFELLRMSLDLGELVALAMLETGHLPKTAITAQNRLLATVETAAFILRLILEMAANVLRCEDKLFVFMTELEGLVKRHLTAIGYGAEGFAELLKRRYPEYLRYRKWVAGADESVAGTLFWEFGKRLADVLGIGRHPYFQFSFAELMLGQIRGWGFAALLRGRPTEQAP